MFQPDEIHLHLRDHIAMRDHIRSSGGGGGGSGSGPPPPLKNYQNIGFSSNTGPDPLKNRSYQASIQCGSSSARQRNAI